MDRFFLPKGTVVKHGTNLSRLRSILTAGLHVSADRHECRVSLEHQPEIEGIYVGNLTAYFGAYAAYSAEIVPFMSSQDFYKVLLCFEDPQKIKELALADAPVELPVVLSIRLKEDCLIFADEDYVDDGAIPVGEKVPDNLLVSDARRVWDKWQTGCIMRNDGIPPDWIETVEYPRLGALEASDRLHKDTWADCELLVAGVMQAAQKEEPAPLVSQFKRRYGRVSLSQNVPATVKAIAQIENLKGMSTNHNRYFNHVLLTQTFEHMAEHFGVPLHRASAPAF